MHIDCSIQYLRCLGRSHQPPCAGRASVGKSKLKGAQNLELQCFTRNQQKIPTVQLTKDVIKTVQDSRVAAGLLSIMLKDGTAVLISKTDATRLSRFRDLILSSLNGNSVDLATIQKAKPSDLVSKRKNLEVKGKEDLKVWIKSGFPQSLEKLAINDVLFRTLDPRLFACTNLTTLDLSRTNLLAETDVFEGSKKCSLLSRMKALQRLDLSSTNYILPWNTKLPPSLLYLNLSDNKRLRQVPSCVYQLPRIRELILNKCNISTLPCEIVAISTLQLLDVSDNPIKYIPYVRRSNILNKFYFSGCPLNSEETFTTPRNVPTLESICAAVVRQARIKRSVLPWTTNIILSNITTRCYDCFKFFPSDRMERTVCLRMNLVWANMTDYRGSFACDKISCGCSRASLVSI